MQTDESIQLNTGQIRDQTDLVVELAVDSLAIGIDQFESVRAIAVHVTVAIRQTSITEQERHLHRKVGQRIQDTDFGH